MELSKQDLVRLVDASRKLAQYQLDCIDAKIEFSGRFSSLGELDFADTLFDIMGLPADNSLETNCCDVANKTGEWPPWGFCRDSWHDLFFDGVSPEEIVNQVLEYVNKITPEEWEAYNSAPIDHPN